MNDSQTSSETQHDLLDQLCQQFLVARRKGEAPDVEEYARLHPELADDIRELFPAVVFAEQLHAEATDRNLPNPIHQAMQLGPFHLQREIGSGGMGIVYEATQSPFTQKFAVKILKPRAIQSSMLEARFAREAQAASQLHHPNIVPAKYYGSEANQNYLVMPMIDGISLDKLILADASVDPNLHSLFEDICRDWQRIAELGSQVASALAHAHSHGMIHRDIKPANLILARDGKVWVTDFGLAKLRDDKNDLSRAGEMIGTPRFMAPEQIVGAADERSDLYGLGLTLYDLVTRECCRPRSPIADTESTSLHTRREGSSEDFLSAAIPDVRKLNPAVPECLAQVIMKACAHHPDDRYPTASELELALNELVYQGKTDRRDALRSRQTLSEFQARCVAALMTIMLILLSTNWFLKPTLDTSLSSPSLPDAPHAPNTSLPKHFITFDEPGTDLINAVITISSRADDAEEYGEGRMFLDSRDLEMTWDAIDQIVGLRFVGVDIEPGAEIHSAKLCFYAERSESADTALQIYGVDDVNPTSFTPLDYDISKRPRLDECVLWTPERWKGGKLYESPDCKEIVQAIINKPDWQAGNAIAFVIDGKGKRVATAYDGNYFYGPMLKIQYRHRASLKPI